jgi:hypothetical protein
VTARVNPQYGPAPGAGEGDQARTGSTASRRRARTALEAPLARCRRDGWRRRPSEPAAAPRRGAQERPLMPPGFGADFFYLLPEIVLTGGRCSSCCSRSSCPAPRARWPGSRSAVPRRHRPGAAAASSAETSRSPGLMAVDGFGLFFKVLFLLSAALTVLMSPRYLEDRARPPGEYYFLVLCATLGMMFMAGGIDLITLFIGLETMAVSFYILAGFLKPNRRSNEAAVKYFVLGTFSLGLLLYGMSLLYGLTGTTHLREIATALAGERAAAALRRDPAGGRPRLQDRRRAVPHVGARRLRGRPDAGHRVPLGRLEGGLVRDAAAHLHRGLPAFRLDGRRGTPFAVLRAGGPHDDGRQPRGADAEQHQADAGVFVDRARRLHAHRRRGRHRRAG